MTTRVSRAGVKRRAGAPAADAVPVVPSGPQIVGRKPGSGGKLKGAFFGPPKTGKTTLATSGRGVLLIQFDPDGDITETLQGREDITVVEPKTFKETEDIVRALATTDAGIYEWRVVDSVGFMFQRFGGEDINKVYRQGGDIRRPYGKAGAAVGQIIHDLVVQDAHTIFTAHLAHEDGDEDTVPQDSSLGEHEVKLAVTPMVWKVLGPAVSFIGRTFKETVYENGKKTTLYRVSFNDGERSPAGARISLPGEMDITSTALQELADKKKEV